MGRWTQYDEDDYRLPAGMKRIGYDSDTGKYYFRDTDGSVWEGPEGSQYGEMKKVSDAVVVDTVTDDDDIEAAPTRADGYRPLATDPNAALSARLSASNIHAYRAIFPFVLIILVVLLLMLRLVLHPSEPAEPEIVLCKGASHPYRVKTGDTCWDIAQREELSLDDLRAANPGLECQLLTPSEIICLPESKSV